MTEYTKEDILMMPIYDFIKTTGAYKHGSKRRPIDGLVRYIYAATQQLAKNTTVGHLLLHGKDEAKRAHNFGQTGLQTLEKQLKPYNLHFLDKQHQNFRTVMKLPQNSKELALKNIYDLEFGSTFSLPRIKCDVNIQEFGDVAKGYFDHIKLSELKDDLRAVFEKHRAPQESHHDQPDIIITLNNRSYY